MKVIKRNGNIVEFDSNKIENAIKHAFIEVDGEESEYSKFMSHEIAKSIEYLNNYDKEITVEDIQDIVVSRLIESSRKDVAVSYIEYRYLHKLQRNKYDTLMDVVKSKMNCSNIENQNANVDEMSFGGRTGEASNAIFKQYALDECVSKKSRDNHINNIIYIHDLSSYASGCHNCLTIPFGELLAKGFKTRQTDVRPANSISTAWQLVAVLFQIQSLQQFGGVSAGSIDHTMVPYVRKSFLKHYKDGLKYIESPKACKEIKVDLTSTDAVDISIDNKEIYNHPSAYQYAYDKTVSETYQACEGMFHNLQTLQSRSGNQLPFTSINFGTCTLTEGRIVIKALLENSIKGVGSLHTTPIFPCSIFQCMKGVNRCEGDPNYDLFKLALKSTAKRLYPNYANVDWSGNAGYNINDPRTYFSTMGCRTANGYDINGFGQLKDGRGNICPVTIILPTVAMQTLEEIYPDVIFNGILPPISDSSKSRIFELFISNLSKRIEEAKDMLLERFEYICSQPVESAKFMYENNIMAGFDGKDIRSALKHGTLALGQLGLAEALQILFRDDHTNEEIMKYAKTIEKLFYDKCKKYKDEYKLNYAVYYTPAENLCHTSLKKFKDTYGVIKDVSDKEFFTNSIHVPVWKKMTPFEKIDIESQLTGYSTGGCITYVELESSAEQNIPALETLVNYAMDKDIPYFAINVPNDTCMDCGCQGDIPGNCPLCNSTNIKRLRRVTGYLTADYKTAFNKGKIQETDMREKHNGIFQEA